MTRPICPLAFGRLYQYEVCNDQRRWLIVPTRVIEYSKREYRLRCYEQQWDKLFLPRKDDLGWHFLRDKLFMQWVDVTDNPPEWAHEDLLLLMKVIQLEQENS